MGEWRMCLVRGDVLWRRAEKEGVRGGSALVEAECKVFLMWTLSRASWRDRRPLVPAGLKLLEVPGLTSQRASPKGFTTSRSRGRSR
jgi:hypothetical protein